MRFFFLFFFFNKRLESDLSMFGNTHLQYSSIINFTDYPNVRISFFFFLVSCETKTWGLDALLRILGQKRAKALVAVLDSPMCEVTIKLAHLWNMPFFTWTCPLVSKLYV